MSQPNADNSQDKQKCSNKEMDTPLMDKDHHGTAG